MSQLSNLTAILSHTFVGIFSQDSNAIQAVYAFVENERNSIADRAAALRHLAVTAFGFEGEDAGQDVEDSVYVQQYLLSR
jgi:hypothetical protein